ncbi:MAG TPA: hypothetical protein VJV78_24870 [Polyangiales bacterium]|nr:hypothetical protein [Polyangiales bacterium]
MDGHADSADEGLVRVTWLCRFELFPPMISSTGAHVSPAVLVLPVVQVRVLVLVRVLRLRGTCA